MSVLSVEELREWVKGEIARHNAFPAYDDPSYYLDGLCANLHRQEGAVSALEEVLDQITEPQEYRS